MSQETVPEDAVRLSCVCGQELLLQAEVMGRVVPCPSCGRYLRAALHFVLAARDRAPNLTVQCSCGHFVVEDADRVGKRAQCPVCKRHLMMPQPVVRFDSDGAIRVPRRVLENQLKRARGRRERESKEVTRLETAAHSGRISLRPGEHICVNPECGALLGLGANVCPRCGTNMLTGQRYEGKGPQKDPRGKWKQV